MPDCDYLGKLSFMLLINYYYTRERTEQAIHDYT